MTPFRQPITVPIQVYAADSHKQATHWRHGVNHQGSTDHAILIATKLQSR